MESSLKLDKLNNNNYQTWRYKVELLLLKENLFDLVTKDAPAEKDRNDEWLKRDGQAKAIIGLSIDDGQLIHVRKLTTSRDYWCALKNYHEQSTVVNRVFILKHLCRMRLDENGDMVKHINEIIEKVEEFSLHGDKIAEDFVVALILCSLPNSYDNLITALESRPANELKLEFVKLKLINEHKRRISMSNNYESEGEKAMKTRKFKGRVVTCYYCHEKGHFKNECEKFKADKGDKNQQTKFNVRKPNEKSHSAKKTVNDVGTIENDCTENINYCFMAKIDDCTVDWYIDSAATCHMTNDKNFYEEFNNSDNGGVYLADGSKLKSNGIGNGVLKCINKNGSSLKIDIKDVLYVPQLDGSLLSVRSLTKRGFTVEFNGNSCLIIKDSVIVATASIDGHLYKLDTVHSANKVTAETECIHHWHRVFGHRDPEAIYQLVNDNLASGVVIRNCDNKLVCECCVTGKMARTSFPKKSENRTKSVLSLIHTDLCGPMPNVTPTGNRYILTFIDDYSRYSTVYFLKNKNEVIDRFKEYAAAVKTKFNKKIRAIRSDNGGEYIGGELKALFNKMGIQHQKTAPYSPQQNGVAERKNRSLVEMAKCMLIDGNMNNVYWAEAINTANYTYNRLPTKSCNKTPFELWYNKVPCVQHMKVFGTKTYVKIPDERRRKFDDKAKPLTLVGYCENSKAYRLIDTKTNLITVSRDVKFVDNLPYCVNKKNETNECFVNKINELSNTEGDFVETDDNETKPDDVLPDDNGSNQQLRRSQRTTKGKLPARYACKVKFEPNSMREAIECVDCDMWQVAMNDEIQSLCDNGTWDLVKLPPDKKAIGCKWIYKLKEDETGNVTRYKARLVAQGYTQKFGEDYDGVFAPVVKQTTFRTLLSIAGARKMIVKHIDIKTAFLYGEITEDLYMKQPEGFVDVGEPNLVCKLKKSIYGLKQSARVWNLKINDVLISNGFKKCVADPCLYSYECNGERIYLLIYVDDVILASVSSKLIKHAETILGNNFEIKLLGDIHNYLGIRVTRDNAGIFYLDQQRYIEKIVNQFSLQESKPSMIPIDPGYYKLVGNSNKLLRNDDYRSAIGSLLYISVNSRPDIAASVSILSRKVSCPTELDWCEVKRVIRYLNGTKKYTLALGGVYDEQTMFYGYCDADWAEDVSDRKSNTGYLFKLFGGTISWCSRKQTCVALSSTEAEYVALAESCQELKWLQMLLEDFHELVQKPTVIHEDNQSCIKIVNGEKISSRTKHIDIKYHFVRDINLNGDAVIKYCPTADMVADVLTKPLANVKMKNIVPLLGLIVTGK